MQKGITEKQIDKMAEDLTKDFEILNFEDKIKIGIGIVSFLSIIILAISIIVYLT